MNELIDILNSLHPDVDFETCTTLIDDSILDSVDVVTLVAEIDDVFDVAVPVEELTPDNFNSAQAIFDMIQRLLDE